MRTSIWAKILVLMLILAMLSGCGEEKPPETTAPAETTAPTEATKPTEPAPVSDGKIYMNLDIGTERKAGPTGMYSIRLAVDGQIRDFWFKTKEVVDKADTMSFFSLGLSDTGAVLDVFPLEGYNFLIDGLRVESIGDKMTLVDLNGAETVLSFADNLAVCRVKEVENKEEFEFVPEGKDSIAIGSQVAVLEKDGKAVIVIDAGAPANLAMCPHCQTEVNWILWSSSSSIPADKSGHYRLNQDITLKSQIDINSANDLVLDLNGCTITGNGLRCIVLNNPEGKLSVMDSSEAQTGKITADSNEVNRGVCLWARSGVISLYSGTLDTSHIASTASGLTVDVVNDGIFNMYGGTIIGGHCQANDEGGGGRGGAVRVRGQFNMYGGTIMNGKSDNGGGNVHIEATGSFKMSGGTITGGTGNAASTPITGTVEANISLAEGAVYEKTGGTIEGE